MRWILKCKYEKNLVLKEKPFTMSPISISHSKSTSTDNSFSSCAKNDISKYRAVAPAITREDVHYFNAYFQPVTNLQIRAAIDQFLDRAVGKSDPKLGWQFIAQEAQESLASYLNVPKRSLTFTPWHYRGPQSISTCPPHQTRCKCCTPGGWTLEPRLRLAGIGWPETWGTWNRHQEWHMLMRTPCTLGRQKHHRDWSFLHYVPQPSNEQWPRYIRAQVTCTNV